MDVRAFTSTTIYHVDHIKTRAFVICFYSNCLFCVCCCFCMFSVMSAKCILTIFRKHKWPYRSMLFYLYNFPRHFMIAPTSICWQCVKYRLLIVVAPSPPPHLCSSAAPSAVRSWASLSATQILTARISVHSEGSFLQFSMYARVYAPTRYVIFG